MNAESKVILQITINTIVSLLLIAFVIFKTANKMAWDGTIVVLSILINIFIMYRAREARKLAGQ
jgi:uncharacterized membrane protein YqjE